MTGWQEAPRRKPALALAHARPDPVSVGFSGIPKWPSMSKQVTGYPGLCLVFVLSHN